MDHRALSLFVVLLLASCATTPPGATLPQALDGVWWYAGGEPSDDRELHFSTWPESKLEIDVGRGLWRSYRDEGHTGKNSLFLEARVVAVDDNVITLKPRGRAFQVYYRLVEGRLEYWWGEREDWLKPHVTYVRR